VDLFPSWNKGIREIARALKFSERHIDKSEVERTTEPVESSRQLSVKDYFNIVLPTLLRWKGEEATSLNKKIRFSLLDQPGESWTIDLSPPSATVAEKDESQVDMTIRITSECMKSILAGSFDARKAIADGNIELYGDLSLLKSVGALFSSSGS
jgi:putative sterol carrier protein